MDFKSFLASLNGDSPPGEISLALKALWYDKRNQWEQAHELVQDESDYTSAAIHAYLHRKEGDNWNADYWYRKAKRPSFTGTLDQEWESLVRSECHAS
jgi:hypothetical protein